MEDFDFSRAGMLAAGECGNHRERSQAGAPSDKILLVRQYLRQYHASFLLGTSVYVRTKLLLCL